MMKMASWHRGIKASRDGTALPRAASRPQSSVLSPQSSSPHNFRGRGFTLTELMIAVLVLIVIILATSRIFSAASRVTAMGGASADVLQEVAAIERRLRQDFADLAHDGFFAVRCIAVRNNANQDPAIGGPTAPLINPLLPPEAWVRADQLMFFTNSRISSQGYADSDSFPYDPAEAGEDTANLDAYAQSAVSRVYYGHGIQLPALSAKTQADLPKRQYDADTTIGGDSNDPGVYPWSHDPVPAGSLPIYRTDPDDGSTGEDGDISGTQPNALQWVLARQQVLLADDGKSTDFFFQRDPPDPQNDAPFRNSTYSIFETDPDFGGALRIRNGRVDVCARQMNEVRADLFAALTDSDPAEWNWEDARDLIGRAMSYPRAERAAPTMFRRDQILTSSVIGSACSSFRIEWTYDDGVGDFITPTGRVLVGNIVPPGEQPWFGLDERFPQALGSAIGDFPANRWGVSTFGQYVNYVDQQITLDELPDPFPGILWFWTFIFNPPVPAVPDPDDINLERMPDYLTTLGGTQWASLLLEPDDAAAPIRVYEAFFGPNHSNPVGELVQQDIDGDGTLEPAQLVVAPSSTENLDIHYTPWPSAIRITMTLHDTEGKLSSGREVQFIVRLPKRGGAS